MCQEYRIEGGELRIEMKFSDRPLQIVKLDEITGLTLIRDTTLFGLVMVFAAITLLSLLYIPEFGILMGILTLMLMWQCWNRGRITVIHARSHSVLLRGHHPEIWEKIKG